MIRLDSISKSFEHKDLFKFLNLHIKEHSITIIGGRSGSGKTTLLRMIRGEIKPDSGRLFFGDKNIFKLNSKSLDLLRQTVAISYQDVKLLNDRTVIENIALPLRIQGKHGEILRNRVEKLIELFKLEDIAFLKSNILSGGEKRKVSLAMSMSGSPDVLLVDEPISGLDPESAVEVIDILRKLPYEDGITLVIASHSPELKKFLHFGNLYKIINGKLEKDFDYTNLPEFL